MRRNPEAVIDFDGERCEFDRDRLALDQAEPLRIGYGATEISHGVICTSAARFLEADGARPETLAWRPV